MYINCNFGIKWVLLKSSNLYIYLYTQDKNYKHVYALDIKSRLYGKVLLINVWLFDFTNFIKHYNWWQRQFVLKYMKIKIKSKFYRLYVNNKNTVVKSHINYGHIVHTYLLFSAVIKLSKYKLILYGQKISCLNKIACDIRKTKPYNIFTARGFRLNRQRVYKKVGKVSLYR